MSVGRACLEVAHMCRSCPPPPYTHTPPPPRTPIPTARTQRRARKHHTASARALNRKA
jgi:hypothetical protein